MTPIELHRAYTYQFVLLDANPYMFERYRGWWPVFVRLCREVDEALGPDKRGFRWVQVKEKFGVARFYWQAVGGDRAIENDIDALDDWHQVDETLGAQRAQMIRELVRTAENETKQRCIACGAPGELDKKHGWWLTVCPLHRQLTASGARLPTGMRDDEDVR